ncbi:S-adenosyl-L-methionine-dependent methyltransferase [Entophlyctis helioformis]|nr:S-adenosyl-L-methionine-dependent methyltransferase [Entophlyctis helioformis]KAI8919597.1 S-adenosyl-L-methionine-dependent methyltransferase [Entophlyctis helioformis]
MISLAMQQVGQRVGQRGVAAWAQPGALLWTRTHRPAAFARHVSYWDAVHERQVEATKAQSFSSTLSNIFSKPSTSSHMADHPDGLLQQLADTDPLPSTATVRMTAAEAAGLRTPPTNARMLTRDFIHTSLYHPGYGYFSKNAYIFSPPEPIQFNAMRDNYAFMNHLGQLYKDLEDEYIHAHDIARQVWHTPTELFRPYYGYAIAKHVVDQFKLDPRGADRIVLYEIGAGNGTLMTNILDYIAQHEPALYRTVKYNIIEISTKLAGRQERASSARRQLTARHPGVRIVNKSIFEWDQPVQEPCFFIAMEVIDNFAHDVVRYDIATNEPRQGVVLVGDDGNYLEAYEPLTDPLIKRYLDVRSQAGYQSPVLSPSLRVRAQRALLPFAANMTEPEFVPTMALVLMDRLATFFPNHRLVIADFDRLPDAVPGVDAPVVQTRYQGKMVACSTYLVQPGWFDIFFPTNFELLRDVYRAVTGRQADVVTQHDFLRKNADLPATSTKSGENPMLSFYENFKFITS